MPVLLAAAALAAAAPSARGGDPAARGLDLFLHGPTGAVAGGTLEVQAEALGFPTATTLVPLAGAVVEARWNDESLGPTEPEHAQARGAGVAPVRAVADAEGRVRLAVPVPDGDERSLRLEVSVTSGGHARTRALGVLRSAAQALRLFVADTRVVPGGSATAWVLATDGATGAPLPAVDVDARLLEGGVARHATTVTTDAAGTAMLRVPIPRAEAPTWSWLLEVRHGRARARQELVPRQETPGEPELGVRFVAPRADAGTPLGYVVALRDASGAAVAGAPAWVWTGPSGTTPPEDDAAWAARAAKVTSDARGEIRGTAPVPGLSGRGARLLLAARAEIGGRRLEGQAWVPIAAPAAALELVPESGALVPGVAQRLLLRMHGDGGAPVRGVYRVEGDGLAATAATDAFGEAELEWRPPRDVGAFRNVGPCNGGVAATVRLRGTDDPADAKDRTTCVAVDREAPLAVSVDSPVARAGTTLQLNVQRAARAGGVGRFSVVAVSADGRQAATGWLEPASAVAEVKLPRGARGAWTITLAAADPRARLSVPAPPASTTAATASVLVVPPVLPRLGASPAGGRLAPGGEALVDVDLTDGRGRGLPGTIAGVLVDAYGGSSLDMGALDTRRSLCAEVDIDDARCDGALDGESDAAPLVRAALATRGRGGESPASDPAHSAAAELEATFRDTVRALEAALDGAVGSRDDLRALSPGADGRWRIAEEVWRTIAGGDEPKLTPGGEPLVLDDLVAVDPALTFDTLARRVTRVRLLRVLAALRAQRKSRETLATPEPVSAALLAALVREHQIDERDLSDPWGGTLSFVRPRGPLPMNPLVVPGKALVLAAAGPDGRAGTGDDVWNPFGRVLAAGTPWALLAGEQRIVDAAVDLELGDPTVEGWQTIIEAATGSHLGGQGFGSGHGRLGGSHRTRPPSVRMGATRVTRGVATGDAYWTPPVRTDEHGHVRLRVPLGDVETTWRLGLVGIADGATPASTTLDLPVAVPLSARVDAGARWIEGDRASPSVAVRNRTDAAARVTVRATARGAVALVGGPWQRVIDVPAGGVATLDVPLSAPRAGEAELRIAVSAPGLQSDTVVHRFGVEPAGERRIAADARWVDDGATVTLTAPGRGASAGDAGTAGGASTGERPAGPGRLVVERGDSAALSAALEALEPDGLAAASELGAALESARRIERWAGARGEAALGRRAGDAARRAVGRLSAVGQLGDPWAWAELRRAKTWAPIDLVAGLAMPSTCPASPPATDVVSLDDLVAGAEVEPDGDGGDAGRAGSFAPEACWTALVGSLSQRLARSSDAAALARAVVALSAHRHRRELARALAVRLAALVAVGADGSVSLSGAASSRATRALVYAALLAEVRPGDVASRERLQAWLAVQRDAQGSYGSPVATAAVVRVLTRGSASTPRPTDVEVVAGSDRRALRLGGPGGVERTVLPIAPDADVTVSARGSGVLVRVERPVIRPWSALAASGAPASALELETRWPTAPRRGARGSLVVTVRNGSDRRVPAVVRIPLPPGVALAEAVGSVRPIAGVLHAPIEAPAGEIGRLEIPLLFGLPGRFTVPQARVRGATFDAGEAFAAARPLVVAP